MKIMSNIQRDIISIKNSPLKIPISKETCLFKSVIYFMLFGMKSKITKLKNLFNFPNIQSYNCISVKHG